ncbi:TPA: hypothetical protein N0F65_004629, partial [Lagenidium giganteum]
AAKIMESIVLQALLYDYSVLIQIVNPFKVTAKQRRKRQRKSDHTKVVGTVQLIAQKPVAESDDVPEALQDRSARSTTYWLRFIDLRVNNERDMPLYVLLSRVRADMDNERALRELEQQSETILLDHGPEGQLKGGHMATSFDQELTLFDALEFTSVTICKPSTSKPLSVLPVVVAYGAFETYLPPHKTAEAVALQTEALAHKMLNTVMVMDTSELAQNDLDLDTLQKNARELFKMFDQDGSNSIDFDEYLQMLAYRKINLLEAKARKFFQLVDEQKKGYIDEREFVIALYITNYLRSKSSTAGAAAPAEALSPVDVFHQLDADRDDLLNKFEFEKAMELLQVVKRNRKKVSAVFPKGSTTVTLEQFKFAWVQLVDVKAELRRRNIDPKQAIPRQPTDEMLPSSIPATKDSGGLLALFSRKRETARLRKLLLDTIQREEEEELKEALMAKDEALRMEKERRDAEQEKKREAFHARRHMETSTRTKEALRERDEKMVKRRERVIKEKQAKEERRLLTLMAEEAEKRKTHQRLVIQELMASKMDKITKQKARMADDVLDLANRGLEELPLLYYRGRDALTSLSSLLIVNLSHNNLRSFPPEVFPHLFAVRSLDLSNNALTALPVTIGEARDLNVLDIRANHLTELPESIKLLGQLKVLHVAFNQLEVFGVPDYCAGLKSLEELNLSGNRIGRLSESISALVSLKSLEMRGNPMTKKLPDALRTLRTLLQANLSACGLKRLGNEVFGTGMVELRGLDVSFNTLTSLPECLGLVPNLQDLNAGNNMLVSLSPTLCNLQELVILRCDHNELEELPFEIDNLYSLEELYVDHNRLERLPTTIGLLRRLRVLHVNSNRLAALPVELGALVHLQALNVSQNALNKLPDELGCLCEMKHIDASRNRLRHLPDSIELWQSLEALCCARNQLVSPFTSSLAVLQALQYVDLSHNRLEHLEPCMYALERLEVLNLACNRIAVLPAALGNALPSLKKLDLYGNKLMALPVELASLLPRLDVLGIAQNPMKLLPDKWSHDWRLEDQYTTTFANGYSPAEVTDWLVDQREVYPELVVAWKALNEQQQPVIKCEAFETQVRTLLEARNAWQPRYQRMVRHYFYEFKYLGHESMFSEVPEQEQAELNAIEARVAKTQAARADDAIDADNVRRERLEQVYQSARASNLMELAHERRKRHEKRLLGQLREEVHELQAIVADKYGPAVDKEANWLQRRRTEFAMSMRAAAQEVLERLQQQKEQQQQREAMELLGHEETTVPEGGNQRSV